MLKCRSVLGPPTFPGAVKFAAPLDIKHGSHSSHKSRNVTWNIILMHPKVTLDDLRCGDATHSQGWKRWGSDSFRCSRELDDPAFEQRVGGHWSASSNFKLITAITAWLLELKRFPWPNYQAALRKRKIMKDLWPKLDSLSVEAHKEFFSCLSALRRSVLYMQPWVKAGVDFEFLRFIDIYWYMFILC